MTIIIFLIILAILIFIHELGHFSFAKMFGIRVDEFAIGFPPKVFSKRKGETLYSINAIPFGGYVKIFGENYEEGQDPAEDKRSFVNASALRQILVLFAGVFFNFLFAWLLIVISLNIGAKMPIASEYGYLVKNPATTITYIKEASPAESVGLLSGDEILFASTTGVSIEAPKPDQIQSLVANSVSGEIQLQVRRDGEEREVFLTATEGIVEGKKAIGVSMEYVGTAEVSFLHSFGLGLEMASVETVSVGKGLGQFIKAIFVQDKETLSSVAGPIGIAGMVGQASAFGFSYLLGFIALISINLAILNLVPFPALDGGRILFVLIEKISRKRIKPIVFNIINTVGFFLIILLMVFVTYKDIVRLVN